MISSITFGGFFVSIISIALLWFIISYIDFIYPRKMPSMGAYYITWDGIYIKVIGLNFPGHHRTRSTYDGQETVYGPEVKVSFITAQDECWITLRQFWKMAKVKVESDVACKKIQTFEDLIGSDDISSEVKKKIIFNMDILK